jgi:hypothetical protein
MESKRLSLLHEMAPHANVIAVLINPSGPLAYTQSNARSLSLQVQVQHASAENDLDAAFATFVQAKVSDPFSTPSVNTSLLWLRASHFLRFTNGGSLLRRGP